MGRILKKLAMCAGCGAGSVILVLFGDAMHVPGIGTTTILLSTLAIAYILVMPAKK